MSNVSEKHTVSIFRALKTQKNNIVFLTAVRTSALKMETLCVSE
jgi:hypothetical protein